MKKLAFKASLPVMFLREGKQFVAYTPVLDLSAAGNTFKQAQKHFAEAVTILVEECQRMGTLEEVLEELGWKKRKEEWMPPVVISHESLPFYIPATV
jgi:predicted Rossmann-fold nucleotide-binding protein